jgi:hypothetical protein
MWDTYSAVVIPRNMILIMGFTLWSNWYNFARLAQPSVAFPTKPLFLHCSCISTDPWDEKPSRASFMFSYPDSISPLILKLFKSDHIENFNSHIVIITLLLLFIRTKLEYLPVCNFHYFHSCLCWSQDALLVYI